MTFATQVIQFHKDLKPNWKIPKEFEIIYPFDDPRTLDCFERFYLKYFSDHRKRHYLFGINPGRFGAGLTGIAFTDPVLLESKCGISNTFDKRNELSSVFIYELIDAFGGPKIFYQHFYITSVCPLGFLSNGINCNYYDDKVLCKSVEKYIISNIQIQLKFGALLDRAYCIGTGKNYKFFSAINEKHHFFSEIIPLPHPRWIMQYRLKRKLEFIEEYLIKLNPKSL